MALQRLIFGPDPKQSGLPSLMLFVFGIFASKRAKAQGYGLHSKEEGFLTSLIRIKSLKILYFSEN